MNVKYFFKAYAKIFSLIIFLFGFVSSICAQYGAPVQRYILLKGRVLSENKQSGISDIKVQLVDKNKSLNDKSFSQKAVTLADGSFSFTNNMYLFPFNDTFELIAEDTVLNRAGGNYAGEKTIVYLPSEKNKMISEKNFNELIETYNTVIEMRRKEPATGNGRKK